MYREIKISGVFIVAIFSFLIITSFAQASSSRIKKMSICYGSICTMGQSTTREFIANNFDLVDMGRSTSNTYGSQLKQINPDLKIIGYVFPTGIPEYYPEYAIANDGTHEHWFVHDKYGSSSSHRIYEQDYEGYKVYFMNPNPNIQPNSYNDFFRDTIVLSYVQGNPYSNGVFSDNTYKWLDRDNAGYTPGYSGYKGKLTFDDWRDDVLDNWADWSLDMMQNAQNALDTNLPSDRRILMPNSWKWTDWFCQQATHMHFYENFIHGRSHAYNDPGYGCCSGYDYGLEPINWLHEQAELGNVIAVNSGCKDANQHPTEAHEWMKFTLACFLFAVEDMDKAYYSWQFYGHDSTNGYFPEMDYQLGEPLGDYYQVQGYVYARQFENYIVAANLHTSTTYNVVINRKIYQIGPRTGLFIPLTGTTTTTTFTTSTTATTTTTTSTTATSSTTTTTVPTTTTRTTTTRTTTTTSGGGGSGGGGGGGAEYTKKDSGSLSYWLNTVVDFFKGILNSFSSSSKKTTGSGNWRWAGD